MVEAVVQRRLKIHEYGEDTRVLARVYEVEVSGAIELFSYIHRLTCVKVEMVWDRVLGNKHMIFKNETARWKE